MGAVEQPARPSGIGAAHAPDQDHDHEARALAAFLRSDRAQWRDSAPELVRRVGAERLRRIVDATAGRVGGVQDVHDSPDGLVVAVPSAEVLAWVRLDPDGSLADLRIDRTPTPRTPGTSSPRAWRRWLPRLICLVLTGDWAGLCWLTGSVGGWLDGFLSVLSVCVLFGGFYPVAEDPWWLRAPLLAGLLAALASTVRLSGLPLGHDVTGPMPQAVLLAALTAVLLTLRRHRWGTPTTAPLRFPLRGRWYVSQGGGRWLNHHVAVPEQRGALDLIRVGLRGAVRGVPDSPAAHLAYGAKVYAPCDGRVVSAEDGIEDQTPGTVRYGPLYGNHVFIDTGTETLKLAHLRPGTVAVTPGQLVRTGDLLGEVGNSGNTTAPHLHIHAERDGQGLDLHFTDVRGHLYRGRTLRTPD